MFAHNKRLQYTVRVNECNPGIAHRHIEIDVDGGFGLPEVHMSSADAGLVEQAAIRLRSDAEGLRLQRAAADARQVRR